MKPTKKRSSASAPGKVILFGEHFVVYGKPAILASIDKRVYVDAVARSDDKVTIKSNMGFKGTFNKDDLESVKEKKFRSLVQPVLAAANDAMKEFDSSTGLDLSIRAEFPHAVGLGSSAAISIATIAAVGSLYGKLNKQKICDMSLDAERIVHNNPSGADSAICTYGGLMLFDKKKGARPMNSKIDMHLIVVDSGVKRITGKLVSGVKKLRASNVELFDGLATMSGSITGQAIKAIKTKDYAELGSLMTLNHSLLRRLGVSRTELDKLVDIALKNGAFGAKMTGAGGGGCIIALVNESARKKILREMKNYDAFVSSIEHKGVIVGN
jgi:mevalonate kinase